VRNWWVARWQTVWAVCWERVVARPWAELRTRLFQKAVIVGGVSAAAAAAKDECCVAANTATPKAMGRTIMVMMIVALGVRGRKSSWLLVQLLHNRQGRAGRLVLFVTGDIARKKDSNVLL
jgi:cyanophycinase-like exopeptidase